MKVVVRFFTCGSRISPHIAKVKKKFHLFPISHHFFAIIRYFFFNRNPQCTSSLLKFGYIHSTLYLQ